LGAENVVVQIALELAAPTGADAGARGQVIDELRRFHQFGIHVQQLAVDKAESAGLARAIQIAEFYLRVVGISQGVDADDLVAITKETLAQMRSQEARAAGYEDFHST
jgi:repressor of nif and glnA expression